MIAVVKDVEGVREALSDLLEESFHQAQTARLLASMDDESAARMIANGPHRTLSPGYYRWAGYLLMLEEMRECGVLSGDLQAAEQQGILQVARARQAFNVAHPACACGQRLESRFVPECPGCGAKFGKVS